MGLPSRDTALRTSSLESIGMGGTPGLSGGGTRKTRVSSLRTEERQCGALGGAASAAAYTKTMANHTAHCLWAADTSTRRAPKPCRCSFSALVRLARLHQRWGAVQHGGL